MSLAKQEFTNAGRSMLGRAQNGEVLTITKIVVGDGVASQPSDLWPLTALIDTKLNVTISTKNDYGNGTLMVEGSFTSDAATAPFYLREVGVLAHIGAEADRLYSVSNVYTDPPDYIDPAAPTIEAFKIKLVIDRIPTTSLIVQIGPSENVIGSNIGADTVGPGVYHDAAGNVLNFKRLVQGVNMDIHDSADGNSIYIGTATLQQNVDLYVPANNPDVPINPATNQPYPNTLFASIQAAHDYLLGFRIPAQYIATIHVHEVNHAIMNFSPSITISHPDGSQIAIIGEARVDKVVSKIQWVSATQKDVFCTDITGLTVGMYVWIGGPVANPNSGSPGFGGGAQIASINTVAKSVRVNIWNQSGGAAYNVTDTNANRLSYLPTKLQISPDPTTLGQGLACPNGISSIANILIIGHSNANLNNTLDQSTYLAYAFQPNSGGMTNCMAVNSRRGLTTGTDNVSLGNDNVFANCAFGIVGGTGGVAAFFNAWTFINGCGQGVNSGGQFALGSIIGGNNNTAVWLNHNLYGVNIGQNCGLQGGTWWALNNWRAIQAGGVGSVQLGAGYGTFLQNNGLAANGYDIYCQGMSYVRYDRWNLQMPVCNPAVTSLTPPPNPTWQGIGNQNACIYILDTGGTTGVSLDKPLQDFLDRALQLMGEEVSEESGN